MRKNNENPYYTLILSLFIVPAINLYLVLDEFAVECLIFWSQTLVSWQTRVQFETLITFELPSIFSQHEIFEMQETSAKVHSFVRNDKRSYMW